MLNWNFDKQFNNPVIGVDEVGRGPWAGPVVSGAVYIPRGKKKLLPKNLNDSKKLSSQQRQLIMNQLEHSCIYGTGFSSANEIDSLGIIRATWLSMERAINNMYLSIPSILNAVSILIDGPQKPDFEKNFHGNIYCIKGGDGISPSIAAASIIAKQTRDQEMKRLDVISPGYGWSNNMGYGTKEHQKALAKHGPTQQHRKSFKPIKKLLRLNTDTI